MDSGQWTVSRTVDSRQSTVLPVRVHVDSTRTIVLYMHTTIKHSAAAAAAAAEIAPYDVDLLSISKYLVLLLLQVLQPPPAVLYSRNEEMFSLRTARSHGGALPASSGPTGTKSTRQNCIPMLRCSRVQTGSSRTTASARQSPSF